VESPEALYAWNGDDALAYQVVGDGPVDLVYFQGFGSHVIVNWEHPACARFLRDLSRFSRLIVTDRRGLGCSERFTPADIPPIETLVDDLLAVLDAVESKRPTLFATGDCAFITMPFAAVHPDRVAALILYEASATWRKSAEIQWGQTDEELEESDELICRRLDGYWSRTNNPSLTADTNGLAWCIRYERLSLTPGGCFADAWRFGQTDVRSILPTIQVPTLVLCRRNEAEEGSATPRASGSTQQDSRFLASRIRGAKLVELPGIDHFPWADRGDAVVHEVERFLKNILAEEADLDRVLATVLFTDIVGSTEKATQLGDARWRELVERHHATVRALLARYRGEEIDTAGDGFFASFDGPARAVRCAEAAVEAVRPFGIEIRAGLHTGEVETIAGKVGGVGVAIGARIGALAGPSEVLVSHTVKDLVAGSGLQFEDRGEHELAGIAEKWHVFAASI
jgi:class 3 adenylate cyclase